MYMRENLIINYISSLQAMGHGKVFWTDLMAA